MSTLIFDIHASIHFQDVRSALIRIPEVIQKIREVQDLLDRRGIALDLSNFIASDDGTFLHHYRRKEFASIVIQLGLYDRYLRYFEKPTSVIGVINSISAVRVVIGKASLEELVDEAFKRGKTREPQELPGLPVLTGIQIPKYQRFDLNSLRGFESNEMARADLVQLIEEVDSVYDVGIGNSGRKGTIELDPQLMWVWDQLRSAKELQTAN